MVHIITRVHVTGRQEDQDDEAGVQSKWAPVEAGEVGMVWFPYTLH